MKGQIPARDYELLSAYLDGQLTTRERARLEARLQTTPALRSALEDLRKTKLLLRSLPKPRRPRSFVLSPKMVSQRPTPALRLMPAFSLASAVSSLLLILVLMGDFIGLAPRAMQYAAPAPAEPLVMEAPAADSAAQAENYAAPAEPPQPTEPAGLAMGSGQPTEDAVSSKQAPTPTATDMPMAAMPPEPSPSSGDIMTITGDIPEVSPTPNLTQDITASHTLTVIITQVISTPTATAIPDTATPTLAPSSTPSPEPDPFPPSPTSLEVSQAQPPSDTQFTPTAAAPVRQAEQQVANSPALRTVEILLGLLAVATGLTAFFLRRGAK